MRSLVVSVTRIVLFVASMGATAAFASNPDCNSLAPLGQAATDTEVTITSPSALSAKRTQLIQYLWSSAAIPQNPLNSRQIGVPSPIPDLSPLVQRVDKLTVSIENIPSNKWSYPYHYIPASPNGALVIVQHGHSSKSCSGEGFNDDLAWNGTSITAEKEYGMHRLIQSLLKEGFGVVTMSMPGWEVCSTPNCQNVLCHDDDHRQILETTVSAGSSVKILLEPIATVLAYLRTQYTVDGFPAYNEFDMVGLSGGGWAATWYAALDPSIKMSIPIAGTLPLYLRNDRSGGDCEQRTISLFSMVNYLDLYVMGSFGAGRKQVHVVNRRDGCCFSEADHDTIWVSGSYDAMLRDMEREVRSTLYDFGATGNYRLEIDEVPSNVHTISWNTVVNTVLAELGHSRRYIGARTSSEAFVRGLNGSMWRWSNTNDWGDTTLELVGVPFPVSNGSQTVVLHRNNSNHLVESRYGGLSWASTQPASSYPVSGRIISDPGGVYVGSRIDVLAVAENYELNHWQSNDLTNWTSETVSTGFQAMGSPIVSRRADGSLDVFVRGADRSVRHLKSQTSGNGPWTLTSLGGQIQGYPGMAHPSSGPYLFVRGLSNHLFVNTQPASDSTTWTNVSVAANATSFLLSGSPSGGLGPNPLAFARQRTGALSVFEQAGSWIHTSGGGVITGSPTAVDNVTFVRGQGGSLFSYTSPNGPFTYLGGLFE